MNISITLLGICPNCHRTDTTTATIQKLRMEHNVVCTGCWAGEMILARAVPVRRIEHKPIKNKREAGDIMTKKKKKTTTTKPKGGKGCGGY